MVLTKTAGVRDLKTHLSRYLRDVAGGEVVLVTDRGRVAAELRPPGEGERSLAHEDLRYRRLVGRVILRSAAAPGTFELRATPRVRLARGTSQALLDAERWE